MDKGFILVATGAAYLDLARQAATSLKRWMPDIPIDIFTDQDGEAAPADRLVRIENPWRRSKIDMLSQTRFEKTVFLDADVIAVDAFDEVFEALERYQICGVFDQMRMTWNANKIWRTEVPEVFPQVNTGFLVYRREEVVLDLFRSWSAAVRENNFKRDQPSFRELLWLSDLRFLALPDEYNFMTYHRLKAFNERDFSPRLIHAPRLHRHLDKKPWKQLSTLEELMSPKQLEMIEILRAKRHEIMRQTQRRRKDL